MNGALSWAEGQVDGSFVNKDQREHEPDRQPDAPVAMGVLEEMVALVQVIARIGALALDIVLVCAQSCSWKVPLRGDR